MDDETREFLENADGRLSRRTRRAYGVVPIALPIPLMERKAARDGVDLKEVIQKVLDEPESPEARDWIRFLAEAATQNSTSFFRHPPVFDHFRDVTLPALIAARQDTKKLRVWAAGCSTGQEAYSLATILLDNPALEGWDIQIIGTDISKSALAIAEQGRYQLGPMELLHAGSIGSEEWREKYFDPDPATQSHTVKQAVRDIVDFRDHNLLDGPDAIGEVDVIFCRHVMMHFVRETAVEVMEKMACGLPADGRLYVGRGEGVMSVRGHEAAFEQVDTELGVGCLRPLHRPGRPTLVDIPGTQPDPDAPEPDKKG